MADKILLVGINRYSRCPLRGCVNDVQDMANFLVDTIGIAKESIRLLVDERATTSAILERLHWLVDAQPNDRILFHYSGHGAQIATRNRNQEVDGLDEIICPVDFDWSDNHLIRDKQFNEIFSKMPHGVKFNWISDSCHSGDLTRDITQHLPKQYLIPEDIAWRNDIAKQKGFVSSLSRPSRPSNSAQVLPVLPSLPVGFISGCRSNQTSADAFIGNKYSGALTHYLLKALKKQPNAAISDIINLVGQELRANGYDQQPTCDGVRASLPFLG